MIVSPDQQVYLASFHLEGMALQWHRWYAKYQGPVTWTAFIKALLLRFGPIDFEDPLEALTCLRQTTTVAIYQESFERLSHCVDGLLESFLIGCFIAGLKDEIRLNIKIKNLHSLTYAIGVARLTEEQNMLQRRLTTFNRSTNAPMFPRTTSEIAPGVLRPPPTASIRPPPQGNTPAIRRISTQEARESHEKGLCFYCDEKFIPGHRCTRPQLFMLEDVGEPEEEASVNSSEDDGIAEALPEISLHAIARSDHPRTIRVSGIMKNRHFTVLIDGGSTHNFIDHAIVTRFGLPMEKNRKLQVMVANQDHIEYLGECKALMLQIQGCPIIVDFFILPLSRVPLSWVYNGLPCWELSKQITPNSRCFLITMGLFKPSKECDNSRWSHFWIRITNNTRLEQVFSSSC